MSFPQFEGHEALRRILLLQQGRFTVDFEPSKHAADGSRPSLDHALADAMVSIDESRLLLSRVGENYMLLQLQDKASGLPALEFMRKAFPIRLVELVVAMQGDLRSNAALIVAAVERGCLFNAE